MKESDQKYVYQSIAENSPDYIMRYDRDFRHLFVNEAGLRITGAKKEQIFGKTHREAGLFELSQCKYWEEKIGYVFKTGKTYQEQFEWQSSEGLIWLDLRLTPEKDDKGNIISVLGVSRDITKLIQTEKSLRETEEIFHHFMLNSPIYVFFKDTEIRSARLSRNFEQMLGRPLEELLGKTMDDLFPSDMAKKMVSDDKRILKTGKSEILDEEFNGRYFTTFKFPIIIDEKPKYLAGYTIDITDKKKSEEKIIQLNTELENRIKERTSQLETVNKELEAFAYSVSHDLRAPLRAIDGFSKFVLEDYESKLDPEGKRLLGLIRSNSQKMDQLITDILALSRVSRGVHKVSKVNMTKMSISIFNESVTHDVKNKVRFIVDPMPDTFGDLSYLKMVWTNLISNAVKFSSKKNKIVIRVGGHTENDFNIYYIKDNGVGFNPEYSHKLFGVFQRLHKSDEFEGTGVGLAIVQRIVLRHGGKVWAEGEEGMGATFWFSLPVKSRGEEV